jgi:hypothetical protein
LNQQAENLRRREKNRIVVIEINNKTNIVHNSLKQKIGGSTIRLHICQTQNTRTVDTPIENKTTLAKLESEIAELRSEKLKLEKELKSREEMMNNLLAFIENVKK